MHMGAFSPRDEDVDLQRFYSPLEDYKVINVDDDDDLVVVSDHKVIRNAEPGWIATPQDSRRTSAAATRNTESQQEASSANHRHHDGRASAFTPRETHKDANTTQVGASVGQDDPADPVSQLQQRLSKTTLLLRTYNNEAKKLYPEAFKACTSASDAREILVACINACVEIRQPAEIEALRVLLLRVKQDRTRVSERTYKLPMDDEYFADGWDMVTEDLAELGDVGSKERFILSATVLKKGEE